MSLDKLQKTFYIGSCRYQCLFDKIFPPRLHTTREFVNFFKNYKNIDIHKEDACLEWGDIAHPLIVPESQNFLSSVDTAFDNITGVVLEICSRKFYLHKQLPLNAFFVDLYKEVKIDYSLISMTDDEIYVDLKLIKNLLLQEYNIQKLAVISHVNLPLRDNNLIPERASLCRALDSICKDLKIIYIDPATIFSLKSQTPLFLDDILYDTHHYGTDTFLKHILYHLRKLKWE